METEGIWWAKKSFIWLHFSLEEIQDLHMPFTQTTKQTDEDDGAVITALNNTGSFL